VKALTIRQPWASLIMAGIKDVEDRSWRTTYRGRLIVHAGRIDRLPMLEHGHLLAAQPPAGAVIGTVEVVGCVRDYDSPWALRGLWHWVLADPQPLDDPVPFTGRLGLWNLSAELHDLGMGPE
jgi:ASCH domain